MVSRSQRVKQFFSACRMFGTLDGDADLARDLVIAAQSKKSLKERAADFVASVPLLGGVVAERPPEEQRLEVR